VEIVEMDDAELYVFDDVLTEASAARYQLLPKKSKLRYQKEFKKFTSEWKPVSERQWAKNDEGKWSEGKRKLHPLVTEDTNSYSRAVSNEYILYKLFKIQHLNSTHYRALQILWYLFLWAKSKKFSFWIIMKKYVSSC
jgi:hypothetical protein